MPATLAEAVGWLRLQHLRALEKKLEAEELFDAVMAMLADGFLPDGATVRMDLTRICPHERLKRAA
jgi:hypothetical protein